MNLAGVSDGYSYRDGILSPINTRNTGVSRFLNRQGNWKLHRCWGRTSHRTAPASAQRYGLWAGRSIIRQAYGCIFTAGDRGFESDVDCTAPSRSESRGRDWACVRLTEIRAVSASDRELVNGQRSLAAIRQS